MFTPTALVLAAAAQEAVGVQGVELNHKAALLFLAVFVSLGTSLGNPIMSQFNPKL
jgi:hypothetical protein